MEKQVFAFQQYFIILALAVGITQSVFAASQAKTGILAIVHGSPSPTWNEPMSQLLSDLQSAVEKDEDFHAAALASLEFNSPSVAEGVKILMEAGCERIVAVPLFMAPSSHVIYDIPAVLGVFSSPEIAEVLREEKAEIAPSGIPVVMAPTLSDGDILLESLLDRVKEFSKNPKEEAIVLLAHGDSEVEGPWEELCRRAACYVCGKTGITHADWAFVEVGQSYMTEGIPAIMSAADSKKRVLVVGIYLSLSPKRLHERWIKKSEARFEPPEGTEIVFAERAFLPDNRTVPWILKNAREVIQNRFETGEAMP